MATFPSPTPSTITRRCSVVLAAALASVSFAACTAGQPDQTDELSGEEGKVQRVVKNLSDRADRNDSAGICSELLTENAKAALSRGSDCTAGVKTAIDSADYITLDVKSVKITGDQAVATIVAVDKDRGDRQIVLERESAGADWKISAFGAKAARAVTAGGTTPDGTTPDGTTPAGATTP